MKSLKNIIDESRQYGGNRYDSKKSAKRSKKEEAEFAKGSEFAFTYDVDDIHFSPSIHAMSRARERRPEFNKSKWKDMHKRVAEYIKRHRKKMHGGLYLFYVKPLHQGYIASVTDNATNVRIVTVFPKNHSSIGVHNNHAEERVVIENFEEMGYDVSQIIEVELG